MIPGLPQVGAVELIILLCIILLPFFGGIREFHKGVSGQYEEQEEKEMRLPEKEKKEKAGSKAA